MVGGVVLRLRVMLFLVTGVAVFSWGCKKDVSKRGGHMVGSVGGGGDQGR